METNFLLVTGFGVLLSAGGIAEIAPICHLDLEVTRFALALFLVELGQLAALFYSVLLAMSLTFKTIVQHTIILLGRNAFVQASSRRALGLGARVRELIALETGFMLLLRRTAVAARHDASGLLTAVALLLLTGLVVTEFVAIAGTVRT